MRVQNQPHQHKSGSADRPGYLHSALSHYSVLISCLRHLLLELKHRLGLCTGLRLMRVLVPWDTPVKQGNPSHRWYPPLVAKIVFYSALQDFIGLSMSLSGSVLRLRLLKILILFLLIVFTVLYSLSPVL